MYGAPCLGEAPSSDPHSNKYRARRENDVLFSIIVIGRDNRSPRDMLYSGTLISTWGLISVHIQWSPYMLLPSPEATPLIKP